jgi:hypothetical protein
MVWVSSPAAGLPTALAPPERSRQGYLRSPTGWAESRETLGISLPQRVRASKFPRLPWLWLGHLNRMGASIQWNRGASPFSARTETAHFRG